jgi:hypothetical protein
VAPGQQLARAQQIADRIAAMAPLGVQGTLANARAMQAGGMTAARDHLQGLLPQIMVSRDAAEGVMSFVERRSATFTGE